jgi:hypothetical protein
MRRGRGLADIAEFRLKAIQPVPNSDPANGGNLIVFPVRRTSQHKEAIMHGDGDDAAHCSNGLSAQNYRAATAEDRVIYRKWILGMVVFYSALLLISGAVAIAIDSSVGLTRLTTVSAQPTAKSPRTN